MLTFCRHIRERERGGEGLSSKGRKKRKEGGVVERGGKVP